MNVFSIAWRSIRYRGLGSVLSIISMALGVMLVVAVLSIQSIVEKSFRSNTSFGYNVIVGARGGKTQLTLNTVFYLSKPTGNIPYEYYLAFREQADREREYRNSIQHQHNESVALSRELSLQASPFGGGLTEIAAHLQNQILEEAFAQDALLDEDGTFGSWCSMAIPLALGDFLGTDNNYFRVVGTTPEFFTDLELNVDTGEKFAFQDGEAFQFYSKENRYFEAVLGSRAARELGHQVGDEIFPIHGDPRTDPEGAHIHEQGFKVVGILEPTGTAHDRAVYINLEGFFLMEDHVKPIENEEYDDEEDEGDDDFFAHQINHQQRHLNRLRTVAFQQGDGKEETGQVAGDETLSPIERMMLTDGLDPLPIEQREVTAILVRTGESDVYGLGKEVIINNVNSNRLESELGWSDYRPLKDTINDAAEAANPIDEVGALFYYFVDPIRWLLLTLTTMICVVSGISILVGIYNSMTQRRHEIAVMRALGANREKVMAITLLETAMLALAGGAFGWICGHFLIWMASGVVENYAGVRIGLFSVAPVEFFLFPGLLILALLVGIWPAIAAYRTDVAKSLGA